MVNWIRKSLFLFSIGSLRFAHGIGVIIDIPSNPSESDLNTAIVDSNSYGSNTSVDLEFTSNASITLSSALTAIDPPSPNPRGLTFNGNGHTVTINGDAVTDPFVINGGTVSFLNITNLSGGIYLNGGSPQNATLYVTAATQHEFTPVSLGATGVLSVPSGAASTVTVESISGSGTVDVSSSKTLKVQQTNDTTFSGTLQGSGNFQKSGSGKLTLTSNVPLSGAFTVSEGRLNVDSVLSVSSVQVGSSGTIGGSGTVPNLTVAGTVAPGSSIGTLTVSGNYVQSSGSSYEAEISGDGTSDLIDISGSATIASNATIDAILLDGPTYTIGQTYTILTTGEGITGNFDNLVIDNQSSQTGISVETVQTATDILLKIIEKINPSVVTSSLTSFSPLILGTYLAAQEGWLVDKMITGHLDWRSTRQCEPKRCCCFRPFLMVDREYGEVDQSAHMLGQKFDEWSAFLGGDIYLSNQVLLGLGAGYIYGESDEKHSSDNVKNWEALLSVFGQYSFLCAPIVFEGYVAGGYQDYKTKRSQNGNYSGNTNGWQIQGKARFTADLFVGGFFLKPTIGAYANYFDIDGFNERGEGTDQLSYGHADFFVYDAEGALGIYNNWTCSNLTITPMLTAGYRYIFNNQSERIKSKQINGDHLSSNIKVKLDQDYLAYGQANLMIRSNSNLSLNLFYQINFGQHDFIAHTWNFSISKSF